MSLMKKDSELNAEKASLVPNITSTDIRTKHEDYLIDFAKKIE